MRYYLYLAGIGWFCACGGETEAARAQQQRHADAGTTSIAACEVLADSGVHHMRCAAAECCSELSNCVDQRDGAAYQNCIVNCSFDNVKTPELVEACQASCVSSYPDGAAACDPYLACTITNCLGKF